MEQVGRTIRQNTECLLTLAGVILYGLLKSVTKALGIGWAATLFGVVLTAVGVVMTLIARKDGKSKGIALVTHIALWILKDLIVLVAGIIIAVYIIRRMSGSKIEINSVADLPKTLRREDGRTYYKTLEAAGCVSYTNYNDLSDTVIIGNVLCYDDFTKVVTTDAGNFSVV